MTEPVKCPGRVVIAKSRARHVHVMLLNLLISRKRAIKVCEPPRFQSIDGHNFITACDKDSYESAQMCITTHRDIHKVGSRSGVKHHRIMLNG